MYVSKDLNGAFKDVAKPFQTKNPARSLIWIQPIGQAGSTFEAQATPLEKQQFD